MPHAITATILKGDFDEEIALAYDLLGITLSFELTMFSLNHYYTACWAKMLGVPGYLQSPGYVQGQRSSIIFPDERVIAHLMTKISNRVEPLFAIVETDYFGGVGSQWAQVYRGFTLADENISQISPALKFLGVPCEAGMDEFDTVGLSKYRSMPDYLDKYFALADQLGV